MFLKAQSGTQYSTAITDVLEREFPICEVAGGQFGKPPEFTKGNPRFLNLYYSNNILKYILNALIIVAYIFHFI